MKTLRDNDGNAISNIDGVITLSLSDGKSRRLGILDDSSKKLLMLRKKERHLFRKYNAYGFCYDLISKATKFSSIMLRDNDGTYLIPNKVILDKGKFLHFKKNGFEKQIFLSLEEINNFKQ